MTVLHNAIARYPLASVIVLAAGGLGALALGHWVAGRPASHTAMAVVGYIIPLVFAVAALWMTGQLTAAKPRRDGMRAVFTLGWPLLIVGGIVLTLSLFGPDPEPSAVHAPLLWFTIGVICTAMFEEFLCRGAMQGLLLQVGWDMRRAVLTTAITFALMHFINLVHQPPIMTATQVWYTFCLAVLLGAIMVHTRNLWIPIVLHAIFNFLGQLSSVIQGTAEQTADLPLFAILLFIVLGTVMLVPGLLYLRQVPARAS